MSRLLNAEFSRLFKSRIFWICAAAPLALALFRLTEGQWKFESSSTLVFVLFNGGVLVILCCAIFSSIFFSGTENTVRSKIVVGHKKTQIYFTNVLVNCGAALIFQLIYTLPILIVSFATGTGFQEVTFGIGDALLYKLIETLAILVMAAVFAFLITLIRKNVVAVVASALVIVGCLLAAENIDREISVRKAWLNLRDEVTEELLYQAERREKILSEMSTLRSIRYFIPMGKTDTTVRFSPDFQLEKPDIMAYIYIGEFLLINAAGAIIYRKMDLK